MDRRLPQGTSRSAGQRSVDGHRHPHRTAESAPSFPVPTYPAPAPTPPQPTPFQGYPHTLPPNNLSPPSRISEPQPWHHSTPVEAVATRGTTRGQRDLAQGDRTDFSRSTGQSDDYEALTTSMSNMAPIDTLYSTYPPNSSQRRPIAVPAPQNATQLAERSGIPYRNNAPVLVAPGAPIHNHEHSVHTLLDALNRRKDIRDIASKPDMLNHIRSLLSGDDYANRCQWIQGDGATKRSSVWLYT